MSGTRSTISSETQRLIETLEIIGASVICGERLPDNVNLATLLTTSAYNAFVTEMEEQLNDPDFDPQSDQVDYDTVMAGLNALAADYFAGRPPKKVNTPAATDAAAGAAGAANADVQRPPEDGEQSPDAAIQAAEAPNGLIPVTTRQAQDDEDAPMAEQPEIIDLTESMETEESEPHSQPECIIIDVDDSDEQQSDDVIFVENSPEPNCVEPAIVIDVSESLGQLIGVVAEDVKYVTELNMAILCQNLLAFSDAALDKINLSGESDDVSQPSASAATTQKGVHDMSASLADLSVDDFNPLLSSTLPDDDLGMGPRQTSMSPEDPSQTVGRNYTAVVAEVHDPPADDDVGADVGEEAMPCRRRLHFAAGSQLDFDEIIEAPGKPNPAVRRVAPLPSAQDAERSKRFVRPPVRYE